MHPQTTLYLLADLTKGTFHLYPSSWGYNYSWGSTWIKQHNAVGKAHDKAVVLEEYGGPNSPGDDHAAVEGPWQATVLRQTRLAMDQFWQFGPQLTTSFSDSDNFTIWYNSSEYTQLARDHAAAMLAKPV